MKAAVYSSPPTPRREVKPSAESEGSSESGSVPVVRVVG